MNIIYFVRNSCDILEKKLWAVPMSVAACTTFWVAAAEPLGPNGLSESSLLSYHEWGIQGGLAKQHACLRIALQANSHNFPIPPSRGVEGGTLPLKGDNSREVHWAALLEPMIQRAPVQKFWGHIPEPPPF